jgi:hypothetical protein
MAKIGRNDLCHCGSGKKYKKCHELKESKTQGRVLLLAVGGAMLAAVAVGIASFAGGAAGGGERVWDPAHGHYHNAAGVEVP